MRTRLAKVLATVAVVVGLATPAAAGPTLSLTGPCASVSVAGVNQTDDSGPFVFAVTLSAPQGCQVNGSVNYHTEDGDPSAGGATQPSDYTFTSGTLQWDGSRTSQPISVTVVPDGPDESNEQFWLRLDTPIGLTITGGAAVGGILGSLINPPVAVTSIDGSPKCWDNPPALFMSTTDFCTIGVYTTGLDPNGIKVHWQTVDNGGPNLGYVPVQDAVLTIKPNAPRGDITVQLNNPNQRQFQFELRIFAPSSGVLGTTKSVVTVTPNG